MSRMPAKTRAAALFAALGDETRLRLMAKLCGEKRASIAHLTEGTQLTRQAVTKHLRILERAHFVHARRAGRERLFYLDTAPVREMQEYLGRVAKEWEGALGRLKEFVEKEED